MEGVHGRGRPEVLEQHRDEAELVGDARRLQESAGWRRGDPDNPRVSFPLHDPRSLGSHCVLTHPELLPLRFPARVVALRVALEVPTTTAIIVSLLVNRAS